MTTSGNLILGRYKIIRMLHKIDNYAAVLAVDIMDRSQNIRLLNLYEGEYAKYYASVFKSLEHLKDFLGVYIEEGTLIAVFNWYDYPALDKVFYGDSGQDDETRLVYADSLFKMVLNFWDMPPEIGCAAFRNRNLCVRPLDNKIVVNFVIIPTDEKINLREIICLATDQAKKILLETWDTELETRRFMLLLTKGKYTDAVTLNSAWNEFKLKIKESSEDTVKSNILKRELKKILINLRWYREKRRFKNGK